MNLGGDSSGCQVLLLILETNTSRFLFLFPSLSACPSLRLACLEKAIPWLIVLIWWWGFAVLHMLFPERGKRMNPKFEKARLCWEALYWWWIYRVKNVGIQSKLQFSYAHLTEMHQSCTGLPMRELPAGLCPLLQCGLVFCLILQSSGEESLP